jgi:hypothetical protein
VISPSFFYYDRTFDIVETSIIGGMYSLRRFGGGRHHHDHRAGALVRLESSVTIFGHPIYGAAQLIMSALMIVDQSSSAARASWVQRRHRRSWFGRLGIPRRD